MKATVILPKLDLTPVTRRHLHRNSSDVPEVSREMVLVWILHQALYSLLRWPAKVPLKQP